MTGRTTLYRLTDADRATLTALAAACGLYNPHQRGQGNLSALVERIATVAADPTGYAALVALLAPRQPPPGTGGQEEGPT